MEVRKAKRISVRKIAVTGVLAAVATVLMFLDFSIPIMPGFIKVDFSDLPALLAVEPGDAVVIDMPLQKADLGDILCVFGTGAYNMTMASNYNGQPRPAVVFVRNGEARVVTRRETYEDLYQRDL